MFGWVERNEINSGAQVFSPLAHQNVLSKMKRKLNEDEFFLDWQKYPVHMYTHFFKLPLFFILSNITLAYVFFFFFFPSGSNVAFYFLFFFLFFFSFEILGSGCDSFFLNYFIFLTRRDYFWEMIFIFLINLGDCSFLWLFVTFFFNWASFFNKGIWVKLFKSIFSIPPLFHY